MRLRTIPVLVIIIACIATLGAWTDRPKVEIQSERVVRAQQPWDTIVKVTRRGRALDGYRAVLTVTGLAGTQRVTAQPLGNGRYRLRVHLPEGGFYTYTVAVGDHTARGTVYSIPR
ncbi:MAG TPA: hypothetical protein VFA56_11680 [Gaiellaceae bacterium]|nr:hypothetical protein [Gaiellaceae bacterium]